MMERAINIVISTEINVLLNRIAETERHIRVLWCCRAKLIKLRAEAEAKLDADYAEGGVSRALGFAAFEAPTFGADLDDIAMVREPVAGTR